MVRASRKRMRAAYARARRRRQIWRRRQEAPLPAPSAADDGSDDASEGDFAANTWQWLLRRKAESRRRLRHIDATWCVDGAEAHVEGLSATRVRVERPFRRAEPWARGPPSGSGARGCVVLADTRAATLDPEGALGAPDLPSLAYAANH